MSSLAGKVLKGQRRRLIAPAKGNSPLNTPKRKALPVDNLKAYSTNSESLKKNQNQFQKLRKLLLEIESSGEVYLRACREKLSKMENFTTTNESLIKEINEVKTIVTTLDKNINEVYLQTLSSILNETNEGDTENVNEKSKLSQMFQDSNNCKKLLGEESQPEVKGPEFERRKSKRIKKDEEDSELEKDVSGNKTDMENCYKNDKKIKLGNVKVCLTRLNLDEDPFFKKNHIKIDSSCSDKKKTYDKVKLGNVKVRLTRLNLDKLK